LSAATAPIDVFDITKLGDSRGYFKVADQLIIDWNTKADGSGTNHIDDGAYPSRFGPLFAIWDEDPAADQNVVDFVDRLYDLILGRDNDPDGMAYWKKAILDGRWTVQEVALNFLLSKSSLIKDIVMMNSLTFFTKH